MAIDINEVRIEGRLGADPETRFLGSGTKVVNARVAVQDDYKDSRTQEWKKRTYWISLSAFGHAADELEQFEKGTRIAVFGKWTVEEFLKNGQKTYYNKLVIQHIRETRRRFPPKDGDDRREAAAPAAQREAPGPSADFDDDIPF